MRKLEFDLLARYEGTSKVILNGSVSETDHGTEMVRLNIPAEADSKSFVKELVESIHETLSNPDRNS